MSDSEGFFLFHIADLHAQAVSVAEMPGDGVAEVPDHHDDFPDAGPFHVLDLIFENRAIADGQQGLGETLTERGHPRSLAGGKDHPNQVLSFHRRIPPLRDPNRPHIGLLHPSAIFRFPLNPEDLITA